MALGASFGGAAAAAGILAWVAAHGHGLADFVENPRQTARDYVKHALARPGDAALDLLDLGLTFLPAGLLARVPVLRSIDRLVTELISSVGEDAARLMGRFGFPADVRLQAADGATRRLTQAAVRDADAVLPVGAGTRTGRGTAGGSGRRNGGTARTPGSAKSSSMGGADQRGSTTRMSPEEAANVVAASPGRDWSSALQEVGIDPEDLKDLPSVKGDWFEVMESTSDRAAAYQRQVTGHTDKIGYVADATKFDSISNGVPLDAKGPGYRNFSTATEVQRSGLSRRQVRCAYQAGAFANRTGRRAAGGLGLRRSRRQRLGETNLFRQ